MKLPGPLLPARFLSRPNRFLTVVELEGQEVEAHLPDPGRLRELLVPDARVWVRRAGRAGQGAGAGAGRRTAYTLALAEAPTGEVVSLVTTLANRLVEEALSGRQLAELAAWEIVRCEFTRRRSRFDFLLGRGSQRMLLEVKSVTLVEGKRALFPDAVTARGTRHVEELAAAVREGTSAAVLFVVQRRDAESVTAARSIDPAFAEALAGASDAGVKLLAYRSRVTLREAQLAEPLPVWIE